MSKKGIQRDMLFYMPAKILEGLIGVAAISVYSNLLSPEHYGRYGLINPMILITFTLISGWIYHSISRFSNDEREDLDTLLSTLGVLLLVTQAVASLVLFIANWYFGYNISTGLLVLFYVAYSTFQVLCALLVARRHVITANLISLSAMTLKLAAMVTLYFLGVQNHLAILFGNFIADAALSLVIILKLRLKLHLKKVALGRGKDFLAYGYPLIGLSFTMMIMSLSDRYVIQYFFSAKEVGIYTANYSVASAAFTLLTVGLMRAVYPNILATYRQGNLEQTENLLFQSIRLYLLIAVPAAFGLWMISSGISAFILDTAYTEGAAIIGYVAFGMAFLGFSEYASKPFELKKRTKIMFFISLAGAVFNLILNIIFIPIFGYAIAALTTAAAYVFHSSLMFFFGNRHIRLRIDLKTLAAVFLSAGAMTVVGRLLLTLVTGKIALVAVIFASALVYFVGIALSGCYKNEIILFKNILGGRKHAK